MSTSHSSTLKISISGVRGILFKDINSEDVVSFTKAFSATLPNGTVAIALDNRSSGFALSQIVSATLLLLGRDVINIGILPTPTLKAYIKAKNLVGGVMISASHNPMEYNGFKFIKANGFFFDDNDNKLWTKNLTDIKAIQNIDNKIGVLLDAHAEAMSIHIQNAVSNIIPDTLSIKKKKIKVAIDTLGATATEIIPLLLNYLNISYVSIYSEILYKFPRGPEPVESSLQAFSLFVKENECDVGFAFDPDADRLALVDERGVIIGEEYTLPLSALYILKNHKNKSNLVVNLSSSWLNRWVAQQHSIGFIHSKVGEANVVNTMLASNSVLGGEGNGGVIDPRVLSYGRDSLVGVCAIVGLLINTEDSLSKIVSSFPKTIMKKIALNVMPGFFDLKKIAIKLEAEFPDYISNWADGYHLSASIGLPWIHIRSSNTEPVIRIIVEANTEEEVEELLKLITI